MATEMPPAGMLATKILATRILPVGVIFGQECGLDPVVLFSARG
jgi:hypothetical protein